LISDKTEDYKLTNSENHKGLEEELAESQELGGMAHNWNQVNQVGSKDQKFDEWLIDSSASVHVTNQKEDLSVPKPMTQAVTWKWKGKGG